MLVRIRQLKEQLQNKEQEVGYDFERSKPPNIEQSQNWISEILEVIKKTTTLILPYNVDNCLLSIDI